MERLGRETACPVLESDADLVGMLNIINMDITMIGSHSVQPSTLNYGSRPADFILGLHTSLSLSFNTEPC